MADEDTLCRTCGEPADDGEGYDGECGPCADKRAAKEEQSPMIKLNDIAPGSRVSLKVKGTLRYTNGLNRATILPEGERYSTETVTVDSVLSVLPPIQSVGGKITFSGDVWEVVLHDKDSAQYLLRLHECPTCVRLVRDDMDVQPYTAPVAEAPGINGSGLDADGERLVHREPSIQPDDVAEAPSAFDF